MYTSSRRPKSDVGYPVDLLERNKMTRPRIDVAVIVPAGPSDDVIDTISSIVHYAEPSRVIVVVDDTSTPGDGKLLCELSEDITVIPAPSGAPGGQGGLWVKLAAGYRWVLERYEPRIILRMDADALLIGRGLGKIAEERFSIAPDVGLLGSYRTGPDGRPRDPSWAAHAISAETGLRGLLYPKARSTLRTWLNLARSHGYVDGESVLGGAYIHRYEAAHKIYQMGWFNQPWLASSKLGEDHIMSLLTMAAGYGIDDFSRPVDPMAVKWQGLPAHPIDLLNAGKLVTHSVRYWDDLTERQIREIFGRARRADMDPR
jgi:hypothetical protein